MDSPIYISDECKSESVTYLSQFKRFLLYGSTKGTYFPGSKLREEFYLGENLASLRTVLNNLELYQVFPMMEFVKNNHLDVHEEIIPLVLSECAKIDKWKIYSFQFAPKLLRTGREFLLFFKFAIGELPSIKNGKLLLDFITEWYENQEVKDLADMIQKEPAYCGVQHADLIKMAQLHSKSPERAAVYNFAIGGIDEMNVNFNGAVKEGSIVLHLNRVDRFRQMTDPVEAAKEMALHHHSVNDINMTLKDNKNVWKEAIPHMDLNELMDWFVFMCEKGFLRCPQYRTWEEDFVELISARLKNFADIVHAKIQPARAFQELQRFQNEVFSIKRQFANQTKTTTAEELEEVEVPYWSIVRAFDMQIEQSFLNIQPIGMDISIIIDSSQLQGNSCAHKTYVMTDMAAAMISICMKKSGRNVNIVTFDDQIPVSLDSKETISSMSQVIRDTIKRSKTQFNSALEHCLIAEATDKDLLIVIGYQKMQEMYMESVYAHNTNERKPKFIFINLGGSQSNDIIVEHDRVLSMYGFDHRMINVILGFGMTFTS